MSFFKSFFFPRTPEEYRKTHPRCATCIHGKYHDGVFSDWVHCSAKCKDMSPRRLRFLCRLYHPKSFQ